MFKENYYKTFADFILGAPFGQKRSYGNHGGFDCTSLKFKNQDMFNLVDGQIVGYGTGRDSGKYVTIKHNSKHIKGVDEIFYSTYKHLDEISSLVKNRFNYRKDKFFSSGEILGKMGHTGYCLTKIPFTKDSWRLLTKKEKNNPNCKKAVHGHIEFFQYCDFNVHTALFSKLNNLKLFLEHSKSYFFWQWDKLFINPDIIIKYFMLLQGRRNYGK